MGELRFDYYNSPIMYALACQLNNSNIKTDLIFYCYHDEQAGQLRFNIISAAHSKLPFGRKYSETTLEKVIKDFINDTNDGTIPWDELVLVSKDESEISEEEFILKVYVERLVQKS